MSGFKMPEPVAYLYYPRKKPELKQLSFDNWPQKQRQVLGHIQSQLYTADALRDVLEQAAQVCDAEEVSMSEMGLKHPEDSGSRDRCFARSNTANWMARHIRAMKEQIK